MKHLNNSKKIKFLNIQTQYNYSSIRFTLGFSVMFHANINRYFIQYLVCRHSKQFTSKLLYMISDSQNMYKTSLVL